MVAIAIVAVLATIGIVAFGATQKSSRDAKRKGDAQDIKKALYLYRSTYNTFCVRGLGVCAASGETLSIGSNSALTRIGAGDASTPGLYLLKDTPKDPNGTSFYDYKVKFFGDDKFIVIAKVENSLSASDPISCGNSSFTSDIVDGDLDSTAGAVVDRNKYLCIRE